MRCHPICLAIISSILPSIAWAASEGKAEKETADNFLARDVSPSVVPNVGHCLSVKEAWLSGITDAELALCQAPNLRKRRKRRSPTFTVGSSGPADAMLKARRGQGLRCSSSLVVPVATNSFAALTRRWP
jgi:hypothetical protein